ncbi:nucleotidyl transferase AbiEii/AbiGii toxin family protein [Pinibacter aurantiacus]|uniref:Nucleotidyl transferase AbiEii/AbiGii toxin family protein n=1 Tax=Pinibacter aurantiacus TaxID=2851599 RepID=A0A9E2SCX3_9BACT|nr:nucleotidyl transferase AbiEii/AbiGii toxin family protein [Pinibacter aurantiacus]MBV4359244.1 nucleotidyl transferase AbiEii/AbiGii toxin family protein [Pinibacter aurantiacus]
MLQWNTVDPALRESLNVLMQNSALAQFRLVGGTALSLHLGHRMSIDIDLFTDSAYGSIDYSLIENFLRNTFPFFQTNGTGLIGMGCSYLIGSNASNAIKLDVYYTNDNFMRQVELHDGIRLASVEEIAAMKMDVILRGGRKKDFWDIHEILNHHSLQQLIHLHKERHEYLHDEVKLISQLNNHSIADNDFDPVCLKGKHWEIVKYEIYQATRQL